MFHHVTIWLLVLSIILSSVLSQTQTEDDKEQKEREREERQNAIEEAKKQREEENKAREERKEDRKKAQEERKKAREEAQKEREEKRKAMRQEIQDLKESQRNLTQELNEVRRELEKCRRHLENGSPSGLNDENEVQKLRDRVAELEADKQRLQEQLDQSGQTEESSEEVISKELRAKCQAPPTNVAVNKAASVSSLYRASTPPNNAVDGDRRPFRWMAPGCAIANPSPSGAWLQVDLGGLFEVHSVLITNMDGYAERMRDFDIHVYTENPTANAEVKGTLCDHHDDALLSKETTRVTCKPGPIKGRYVRMTNTANEYLQLCEFQVMALQIDADTETCPADTIPTNVAKDKTASQSSTAAKTYLLGLIAGPLYKASLALDNNFNPYSKTSEDYSSCAITKDDGNGPWWQVDLGDTYNIHHVVIGNRADELGNRLRDFNINVYAEDPITNPSATPTLCRQYAGQFPEAGLEPIVCDNGPVQGRYLRITNAAGSPLQLCEVEVYARPV